MTETLFHAYAPLILWTSLGLLIFKFLPQWFPRLLGRCLYWFGVPLELLALARQRGFNEFAGEVSLPILAPIITLGVLVLGLVMTSLILKGWKLLLSDKLKPYSAKLFPPYLLDSSSSGSFVISAVLGNTGFVGLAIAPSLVSSDGVNWAVLYSITHNVIGTYGFGVVIASYFSHSQQQNRWWMQLRDVLSVPSLWAFLFGYLTRSVQLPEIIESGLQGSVNIVIACAFLLTGIRLAQLQGWKSLKLAFVPAFLRVFLTPLLVGLATTLFFGLSGSPRLAMVLMSGVPTAFAGLILAEEYNLDRDLITSSIIISTLLLLLVLPLWILVFG
ncbi:transporter [Nostocales cyanobacterium HT-58-2]|nr:transporter [Nostocales cyanobacterium HT-58-2]